MIPIFDAEKKIKGLADRILSCSSIQYSVALEPWTQGQRETLESKLFANASEKAHRAYASAGDKDLYFTKSIFVSTNWNGNDEVFLPEPVWASRHTPIHKPTNIEHDDKRLVGHITNTWAVDSSGTVIPEDTVIDDLPELFHLANGAVIYLAWKTEELETQAYELIEQIEAGKKYVSMECLFSNFAYAVQTPENEIHIVARDKTSAFLSEHLRAYGGEGVYDGCRLGRVPLNIIYSGKGYVDNPANKYSVIFTENSVNFDLAKASFENPFSKKNGVLISYSATSNKKEDIVENDLMSDVLVNEYKAQVDELKKAVAKLNEQNEQLAKAHSEAGVKALQTEIVDLKTKLTASQNEVAQQKQAVDTLTAEKTTLDTNFKAVAAAKTELEQQVAKANAEKVKVDRISKLVDGNIEKTVATTKVEAFANLNDEQFNVVATDLIAAAKVVAEKAAATATSTTTTTEPEKKPEEGKKEETSAAAVNADPKVLESAKASADAALVAAAESKKQGELRTELESAFASMLNLKTKKDANA